MSTLETFSIEDEEVDVRAFINRQRPFGPDSMEGVRSSTLLRRLFVDGLDPFNSNIAADATYLLGRKGSGKTIFLHTPVLRDEGELVVSLRSADTYQAISDVITTIESVSRYGLRVDHVADLWRYAIWACVATSLTAHSTMDPRDAASDRDCVFAFCRALNPTRAFGQEREWTPDDVLRSFVFQVQDQMLLRGQAGTFGHHIRATTFGGVDTESMVRSTIAILKARHTRVHVLIDSLEDIHVAFEQLRPALGGLFMFLGQHDNQRIQRELRMGCCFPSEMWPTLSKLSMNGNKDFRNRSSIEWRTRDLLRLAAKRFQTYAREHASGPDRFPAWVLESPLRTGDEALHFMHRLFPARMTNRLGGDESPLTYVVRHTQLLPRQLIIYLNRIFGSSADEPFRFGDLLTTGDIQKAIKDAEDGLWRETSEAFLTMLPHASDIVEAIAPYLDITFTREAIDDIVTQRHLTARFRVDREAIFDTLLDVGCVGRIVSHQRYVSAEFSYTMPGSLRPSDRDQLCLHPMFSQVGSPRRRPQKTVYPEGVELEDLDD
jgi:hypothetical protein